MYLCPLPVQLGDMTVEPLKFRKEISFRKIAVHKSHAVERVQRGNQMIIRFFDRPDVPDGDITGDSNNGKILAGFIHVQILF
jgi:hypothetical protein